MEVSGYLQPVITTYEDVHSGEKLTFVDSHPPRSPSPLNKSPDFVLNSDGVRRNRWSTLEKDDTPQQAYYAVVAIDFGTTYSGYAYSFASEPDDIHIMRKWEGDDPGLNNQKTPTILLLDPERKFHSFGFGARDAYHDLREREAHRWYFFDKFKMVLHHNKVRFIKY